MKRTLLTDALIVTGTYSKKGALAIEGERISGIWLRGSSEDSDERAVREFPDAEVISLNGLTLMAGGIDAHVHFREPGLTHKADIESESKAALLGGVTSFIDMPNTAPPTVTFEALQEKLHLAQGRSWANHGFHLGATNSNLEIIKDLLSNGFGDRFGGIKVFMGSSTGNMLVDNEDALREIFRIKGKPVLIHSEDEGIIKANMAAAKERFCENVPFSAHPEIRSRKACVRSTAKALAMAIDNGTRLHVLHVSTAEEVEMIRAAKIHNPLITAETSPNYLWFSDKDYDRLGGLLKCNPAIKTASDRDALRKGLAEGIIDTIGTDHAPHLLSEKSDNYLTCPSGIPSIQQSFSVLLSVAEGWNADGQNPALEKIPLTRIAAAYSEKAAEIFGIESRGSLKVGNFADLVVLDPDSSLPVEKRRLASKCGWSPYEGSLLKGVIKMVFLSGELAAKDGIAIGSHSGKPLVFNDLF